MTIAVAYQRLYPDGRREPIRTDQANDKLLLSFQELLPRSAMSGPVLVNPRVVQSSDDPLTYAYAFEVGFERPPYVRVLTVMLVLLIAAAAAYSVFLRLLPDLVI